MIHSLAFAGLPSELKDRVFFRMSQALAADRLPEFDYLPLSEKQTIRRILKETVAGLPKDW